MNVFGGFLTLFRKAMIGFLIRCFLRSVYSNGRFFRPPPGRSTVVHFLRFRLLDGRLELLVRSFYGRFFFGLHGRCTVVLGFQAEKLGLFPPSFLFTFCFSKKRGTLNPRLPSAPVIGYLGPAPWQVWR